MFITFSLLLVAVLVIPAVGKLRGLPKIRQSADHFGIPWRRYRLIAVPELAAAAGVLIGLYWRPAGLIAAAGTTLLLLGALVMHWRAHDPARDAVPAVVGLAIAVAYQVVAYAG
jgi:uncharacterized membrane protein YphA (DoxX/SURF4 family)